MIKTKTQHSVQ